MHNFTRIDELDLLDVNELQRDRMEKEVDELLAELEENEIEEE